MHAISKQVVKLLKLKAWIKKQNTNKSVPNIFFFLLEMHQNTICLLF